MPEAIGQAGATGYSPSAYRRLLERLSESGYAFRSFIDGVADSPTVFLRHDVDYSLSWAVEFARINDECGARGTFFLQLRSPLYNLLAFESLAAIREILDLGQWLGFHITLPEEDLPREQVLELIRSDYQDLQAAIPSLQPVAAWHNPSLLVDQQGLGWEIPGFVNAYGRIGGRKIPYYSDSNMRYSLSEFESIVARQEPAIQLALAPMQWLPGEPSMVGILARNLGRKIRDLEVEFIRNHVYRGHFPGGLPDGVLLDFETSVISAAGTGEPNRRKEG